MEPPPHSNLIRTKIWIKTSWSLRSFKNCTNGSITKTAKLRARWTINKTVTKIILIKILLIKRKTLRKELRVPVTNTTGQTLWVCYTKQAGTISQGNRRVMKISKMMKPTMIKRRPKCLCAGISTWGLKELRINNQAQHPFQPGKWSKKCRREQLDTLKVSRSLLSSTLSLSMITRSHLRGLILWIKQTMTMYP